jgi:HD superfamily phosphohydrolase
MGNENGKFKLNFGENYDFPLYVEDLLRPAEVQRLRKVTQLGHTSVAYPNGTQNRFAHSLGVTRYALEMLEKAVGVSGLDIDLEHFRRVIAAAGINHDTGHGPFSHGNQNALEYITGLAHEEVSGKIIRGEMTLREMYSRLPLALISDRERSAKLRQLEKIPNPSHVIKDTLGEDPQLIAQIINPKSGTELIGRNKFLLQIMNGLYDADRLYYVKWDGILTGIDEYVFDPTNLISELKIVEVDGTRHLAIAEKALDNVVQLLTSRANMHCRGYTHKAVLKVECVFNEATQLALDSLSEIIGDLGEYLYLMDDPEFERLIRLSDNETSHKLYELAKFTRMKDYTIVHKIDSDKVSFGNYSHNVLERLDGIEGKFPHRVIRDGILDRVNVGITDKLGKEQVMAYFRKAKTSRNPKKLHDQLADLWIIGEDGQVYCVADRLDNRTLYDRKLSAVLEAISRPINKLDFLVVAPKTEVHRVRKATEEYLEELVR